MNYFDILLAQKKAAVDTYTKEEIDTKLAGKVDDGGEFFEVNGIRVYVSSTTPTGTIPEGSLGIGF